MSLDFREVIIDIFDASKRQVGLELNEDNVFQSLVGMDSKPIDDSFVGKRCKNAFIDALQLQFGVCFPYNDLEKIWSLDALTAYVYERSMNPQMNVQLAKQRFGQVKAIDVSLLIFLMLLCVFLLSFGGGLLFWIVSCACVLVVYVRFREVTYYKRLIRVIQDKKVVRLH